MARPENILAPDAPADPGAPDAVQLAELFVHLGRAARGEDCGTTTPPMTAAQWTALRFFARANSASRTPSAFAEFQATTRGTASQTIKTLVARGLLARRRAAHDRRSVLFELTESGKALLLQDPLRHLSEAICRLGDDDRATLMRLLPELVVGLAQQRGAHAFGTCDNCDHYEDRGQGGYCACVAMKLDPLEIGQLCVRYALRPGDDAAA